MTTRDTPKAKPKRPPKGASGAQGGPSRIRLGVEALALLLVAGALRGAAAWALGGGAPFGPDGTGLDAAIHLEGHLYPLHVAMLRLLGDVRLLSLLSGTASCLLLWGFGRSLGLGGGGGWLLAFLPLGVYTSALSAGDAPALAVVLLGVSLTRRGGGMAVLGGALAISAVAVKPIALPALALLAARPLGLVGVLFGFPFALRWLDPLISPRPRSGLLGSWWVSSNGDPPHSLSGWVDFFHDGALALLHAPLWTGAALAGLALLGALWPRAADRPPSTALRIAVMGPLIGILMVAALFGERLEARYLLPSVVALLPWAGALLPRGVEALLLWPTAALVTQVAAERADQDPLSQPPAPFVVPIPVVDCRPLFEEASTRGATELRQEAEALALSLPQGAVYRVARRGQGREGELVWPLRVLRPDLTIEVVDP